ncbi:MAG: bifunctional MaoC family dehydratase N-terminal/OB-fold nucleic acid binding domain-containing protein [Actinomycetota bacterium]
MENDEGAHAMTFIDQLRSFVGIPSDPIPARDPVNAAMIRQWCDAMGDANPLYEKYAPPAMLESWTLGGLVKPVRPKARTDLFRMLDEAGFTSVLATNYEQEYVRYLEPGDELTATITVSSVSEEKRTALGSGHFIDTTTQWRDANGEIVGTQRVRYLKFRPGSLGQRTPPPMNSDTQFFWEGAKRGELLIQRCASCGVLRHPPRPMCGACRSLEWDSIASTGRGKVFSFVVHHHPPVPGFEIPYVVALIELEEGTRIVSNVIDVEPGAMQIGMNVEVAFHNSGDVVLPVFKKAGS